MDRGLSALQACLMNAHMTNSTNQDGKPLLVAFFSAVTAIGGFLFGYDTAVINGANTYLQAHFALNPDRDAMLVGLATASAIIGCIPGAMSAGFISD
jgi:MFS transporter, SP family, arabinose:H+ symporter